MKFNEERNILSVVVERNFKRLKNKLYRELLLFGGLFYGAKVSG